MSTLKKLFIVLKDRKALFFGTLAGVLFLFLYLLSIQHLFFSFAGDFSLEIADDISSKLFKLRAPFLWEPIALLNLFIAEFFISPMNILIAFALAFLVMINISIAIFSYKYRNVCSPNSSFPLVGILPSMLTGFACCAPTFIIALAPVLASFTVFFIEIQKFLLPASFLIMILGAWWSLWRLPITSKMFIKS